jgi:ubiquinone/menaquinone biosynthesis C-methylase UbiE
MKLEVGSGGNPDPSYEIHMDIREGLPHLDVVGDCAKLDFLMNETIDEIRANDIIEHFSHRQIRSVLKEWLRVLVSGGIIHICTPNFRVMAERYLSGDKETYVVPNNALAWSYWLGGGQDYDGEAWRYNAHYTFFDKESWLRLAHEVGFDIVRLDEDGGTNLLIDIKKR